IWGAAIACFGLTRSLPLALVLLAVAGAADTLTVTFRGSIVQTLTPDEFRGRGSSVEYIIGTGGGPPRQRRNRHGRRPDYTRLQRGERWHRLPGRRRPDRAALSRPDPLPPTRR